MQKYGSSQAIQIEVEGSKMRLFRRIHLLLNISSDLNLWLLVFLVTISVILLVQLVLLPFIFPAWHAGDGLLVGGDWIRFHKKAVVVAERINSQGWSAWGMRPMGWFPTGIAAAVYALTWPKPWTLAPINAAVHATTFLIVMKLLLLFIDKRKVAVVATIPFAFFPSAMLWYTQIHRDSYYILGLVLFIYGLLLITNRMNYNNFAVKGFISSLSGLIMIWLVRPHSLEIFFYTSLLLSILIILSLVIMSCKKILSWKQSLIKLVFLVLLVIIIFPLKETEGSSKYLSIPEAITDVELVGEIRVAEADKMHQWSRVTWLLEKIDNHFYSMALLRTVIFPIRFGEAASSIDFDVSFYSINDFIFYLPRALQIAFLAPFPVDWFQEGGHASTTFFRRVSAFEMVFTYLMLLSLSYGLWIWRKKIEMYILILFCTIMLLPIVYSVPNMGTVYRYRYGYIMLLVSLGVIAFFQFLQDLQNKRKAHKEPSSVT